MAFLLRDFLFGGGCFFNRDVHLVWYPQVESFVRLLASGHLPLWDPAPGFGGPYLARPDAEVLYPATWLNLLLRPSTSYTVLVALHAWLSACGMALLGRQRGLSSFAAFAAAGLWIASGPFVSLFDLWHHYFGAAWIPWVVLAADRAFARRTRWDFFLFGAAAGMQLLAASAEMVVMAGALLAVDLVAFRIEWAASAARENGRLILGLCGATLLAVALSSGQWLTTAAITIGSVRSGLPEAIRTFWSVPPWGTLEILCANVWSAVPLDAAHRAALYESREPFLRSLYLGAGLLALAVSPLATHRRDRRVLLLLLVAAGALLISLGRHAPFYAVAAYLLPPLRMFRYPVKALVLVAFCMTLAAGYGVDSWHRGEISRGGRLAIVGLLALLAAAGLAAASALHGAPALVATAVTSLLCLAFAASRATWAGLALAIVAVLDLAHAHGHLHAVAPRELYTYRPEVVDYIRAQVGERVYIYDYGTQVGGYTPPADAVHHLRTIPTGWGFLSAQALALQMSLSPATAERWGIETGYDMDLRGLYPHALSQLTLLLRHSEGTPLHLRLLRMGGITHVVAVHESGFEDLVPVAHFAGLFDKPVRVFSVPGTLPRTYAIGAVRVAPGIEGFQRLAAPDFDPSRELILDESGPYETREDAVGTSRIVSREPNRVRLEADMTAPGYVVLLDELSSGWTVSVDGRPAHALHANVAFRAVALGVGHHTIEWLYRPTAAIVGLLLSGLTAVVCALVFAVRGRRLH